MPFAETAGRRADWTYRCFGWRWWWLDARQDKKEKKTINGEDCDDKDGEEDAVLGNREIYIFRCERVACGKLLAQQQPQQKAKMLWICERAAARVSSGEQLGALFGWLCES